VAITVLTGRRVQWLADTPHVGALMVSASGKSVYRVLDLRRLRIAGDRRGDCFRLTCDRLPKWAVPEGVAINPWRWMPPRATQTRVERPIAPRRSQLPVRTQRALSGLPRASERHVPVGDFGPKLRRQSVHDRQGRLLREADVEVDDQAGDPRYPNRRVRRAYRVDSVQVLLSAGTIGKREADAAAELRRHLERIAPALGAGSAMRITVSRFLVQPIRDDHIRASRKVREAAATLGVRLWPPVLWICLGGTVRGYAAERRVGTHTASDLVKSGMQRLAEHFYGAVAA
jgi:hypothetical protein